MNRSVESKTRTYHEQVESRRRTAWWRGGAGPSKTGRQQIGSSMKQPVSRIQGLEQAKLYVTCRIQNPHISQTSPREATHGGAARRSGAAKDRTPTVRFAQKTIVSSFLQRIEDSCPERLFGSTNKGHHMQI